MECMATTEEIEIFNTKVGLEIIDFTWISFGKDLHYLGGIINLIYVIFYTIYIN